ncbi:thioredoxin [Escherichia phage CLB_P2]|nr:thioredoxin [Escherichia phage CLB_P2]
MKNYLDFNMNIKTRKEYSIYDHDTTRRIAIDRLADFGHICNGNYTYGVGRKGTYISSLNDYCRRPAHLFGATLRANIKDLLATAGRISTVPVNIKNINFTARNLVINILADGIQVRFRPTSKGNKALREAFETLFREAMTRIKAVESYKVTTDEYADCSGQADAVYIRVKLTREYLLSYAPYQSQQKDPQMERRISAVSCDSVGQYAAYDKFKTTAVPSPFNSEPYHWKIKPDNSLVVTNPTMKPIETYYADSIQESIHRLNGQIEDEKKSIQDVLNRIKNMENQRDKLRAALLALK